MIRRVMYRANYYKRYNRYSKLISGYMVVTDEMLIDFNYLKP